MRRLLLLLVVLGACVADLAEPLPEGNDEVASSDAVRVVVMGDGGKADTVVDICALAAALPADDLCSKVCDPDALATQMEADGYETGACYSLYCALSDTEDVTVGVCLLAQP